MTDLDQISQAIGGLQKSVEGIHDQFKTHRKEVNGRLDNLQKLTEKNTRDLAIWRALRAAGVTILGLGIAAVAAVKGLGK